MKNDGWSSGWPVAIEDVAVEQLTARPDNPRKHSKRQIAKIAKSIQAYGFTSPVLIDEANQILAGHGRLEAAKLLKLRTVPCRRLTNMSEKEKRAYVLADNKLALDSGWDNALLAHNFDLLEAAEMDLTITGFDISEVDNVLTRRHAESTERRKRGEDEVPAVEQRTVTRLGDVWSLGRHKLICGDARDPEVFCHLMANEHADLVFTDPPYNVPIGGHVSGLGKHRHAEFAMASGEMSKAEFRTFLSDTLGNAVPHCRNGAIAFVCMDWRHVADLIVVGSEIFSEFKNLCVWNKTNAGMGTFYRSQHELIGVFKVGDAPHTNTFGLGDTGRYRTNVWSYAGVNTFSEERAEQLARHPTSKPVALVADAIKDVSRRGEIVLDLFGGSGTTLIAAHSARRSARLIEIDARYCDVTIRRWQDHTGEDAVLEQSGATFESIEAAEERNRKEQHS
jgi:DNA modification methylase